MDIIISREQNHKTVGQVLRGDLAFSGAIISLLKKTPDGILLNGSHATVRNVVEFRDVLSLRYKDAASAVKESTVLPVDIPLDILYQDDDIILINKSHELLTHPAHEHQTDTLANGLVYLAERIGSPYIVRPINRLDVGTSGLVLVAKNKLSAYRLSEAMKSGKIHKSYFAVLCGSPASENGEYRDYIRRDTAGKMRRVLCSAEEQDAAVALTRYRTLASNSLFSAVLAAPITGRTHQLRVQFSEHGTPICGDTLYGYPFELIDRQALHAIRLSFPHPSSGKMLRFTAPLPADISFLCSQIFGTVDFPI